MGSQNSLGPALCDLFLAVCKDIHLALSVVRQQPLLAGCAHLQEVTHSASALPPVPTAGKKYQGDRTVGPEGMGQSHGQAGGEPWASGAAGSSRSEVP